MKCLCYLTLFATAVVVASGADGIGGDKVKKTFDYNWDDFDYDSYYDSFKSLDEASNKDTLNLLGNHDDILPLDKLEDYQIEDNRDKEDLNLKAPANEDNLEAVNDPLNGKERKDDYVLLSGDDNLAPEDENEPKEEKVEPKDVDIKNLDDILKETKAILEETDDKFDADIKIDEVEVKKEINEEILKETKEILDSIDDDFEGKVKETAKDLETKGEELSVNALPKENDVIIKIEPEQPKIEKVLEETKPNPEENEEEILNSLNDEISIKVTDEKEPEKEIEEDTVDKAYADLNADLDKLFATLDKLTENDTTDDKKEDVSQETNDFDNDNMEGSEELSYDDLFKDILEDEDMNSAEIDKFLNDALNEPNPDDNVDIDAEMIPKETPKSHPIAFLEDGIEDEVDEKKKESTTTSKPKESETIEKDDTVGDASVEKTVNIDDLTENELEDLRAQFALVHSEDIKSGSLHSNIAPIHITLSLTEPTVITSPNYPNPYPTNNIVDWILEGEGMGIELNITDFAINSALGDFLLIKPGGVDETGHEGLLFSYRLTTERRYRFMDVDRMFIRFQSNMGMMFLRGFQMNVKMMFPPNTQDEKEEPEIEEIISPPNVTARITLAIPIPEFREVKDQFRMLLGNMIRQYIVENGGDVEDMDMDAATKITLVSTCPLNWPNYERCTAVTFGLTFDEDLDLMDMWITYQNQEPYASMLRNLGIVDFPPPDSVMLSWLIIAAGVVIAMAMLAFVLWRFSCFEDYTRMPAYSDTESVTSRGEKRGLDMYPTPHQHLPPLYHENEYKWPEQDDAARVDMSGFANKSYVRDNMYDFESDEEVMPPRDRNGSITPRDFNINEVSRI